MDTLFSHSFGIPITLIFGVLLGEIEGLLSLSIDISFITKPSAFIETSRIGSYAFKAKLYKLIVLIIDNF